MNRHVEWHDDHYVILHGDLFMVSGRGPADVTITMIERNVISVYVEKDMLLVVHGTVRRIQ